MRITRKQREALKRVYDRRPLGMSYRAFRATAQPTFGMQGAIVVPWSGMWLAIETDGYIHS